MELLGRLPPAGTVRIGRPPEKGRNYPTKISFFEFCSPERNKRGFFSRDAVMHQLFGEEPKQFGPVYLISDKPHEAVQISLNIWTGAQGKAKKRKCYKIIDPLAGGVVDDGRPASRLHKVEEGKSYRFEYKDYECLSDKCPDFIKGNCNKSIRYRFFIPNAPRLGEYSMVNHSYMAISSAIGLMNVLKQMLVYEPSTGSLHGLSKIPLMFRIEQGSTRHKGQDVPIWFPVPYTEHQGGAFFFLEEVTKQEQKLLGSSGEKVRAAQLEAAKSLLLEEHIPEDEPTEEFTTDVDEQEEPKEDPKMLSTNSPEYMEEMEAQAEAVYSGSDPDDSVSLTQSKPDQVMVVNEDATGIEEKPASTFEQAVNARQSMEEDDEMASGIPDFDAMYDEDADDEPDDDPDDEPDETAEDLLALVGMATGEPEEPSTPIEASGTLYRRVEKKGVIEIQPVSIDSIPSDYEKCEDPEGEVIEGVFSKQVGARSSDINLILTDEELKKLFDGSTWTSRPNKVWQMLQIKGREYTINALGKNQKG